jgi:hypothetical protein
MAKKQNQPEDDYAQKIQRDADYFAALLSSPKCSQTFRLIFASVFAEMMIEWADFSHPCLVREVFAPVVLWLDRNNYAGATDALIELLDSVDQKFNDSALHQEIAEKGGVR